MARKLGKLEAAAFAYVQMRNLRAVRTGNLAKPLLISPKQDRELLSRLSRAGLIANVRRGLYLFPDKLPLGGKWAPDEAVAINMLMADKKARYQITGPNAFNCYGFDEQIPSRTYVYNDQISGERRIGPIALTLIKVAKARLGDTQKIKTSSGQSLSYSSRVRTLLDAVYDWSRFDSVPRAYSWIRDDIKTGGIDARELVKTTIRFGNQGTIRRMGALLEQLETKQSMLRQLQRTIKSSTARIPFDPTRRAQGPLMKRWGVILNA